MPVLLLLALAASPISPRERLSATQEEVRQERLDIERLHGEETSILEALDAASRSADTAAREAGACEARRARTAAALSAAREREAEARARVEAASRGLAARLRVWQRLGDRRRLSLLLDSATAAEAARTSRLFHELLDRQLSDVKAVARDLDAAAAARSAAATLAGELARREAAAKEARAKALSLARRHAALLSGVRGEKALHQRTLAELARAQGRLSRIVDALPPLRMATTGFAAAKGSLPRPVPGTIEVGFGQIYNPRWSTVTLQKGLDIRAPAGTKVHAIHAGRVVYAGRLSGYGNLLILDHGDGYYTLSAHLAEIDRRIDDLVQAGDALGTVGATGSLKGPYLYFEIRHHGTALDPSQWLAPPAAQAAR